MPRIVRNEQQAPYIFINLLVEDSDDELTEALQQTPTDINEIKISFVRNDEWPLFCRYLATRENLEKVVVNIPSNRSTSTVRSILEAIQRNDTVRIVMIRGYLFPPAVPIIAGFWTKQPKSRILHSTFTRITYQPKITTTLWSLQLLSNAIQICTTWLFTLTETMSLQSSMRCEGTRYSRSSPFIL